MYKSFALFAVLLGVASAFAPVTPATRASTTQLHETFGLGVGEDTYENQDPLIAGEANYKQWVNKYNENNMLNRKYNVIGRVRELNLLKATADQGILSKLEAQGVDLVTIEKLLPTLEDAGLLTLAGNNQQLLVNLIAPLLIEPAPVLLPVIAGALQTGPSAFFGFAGALAAVEALLFTTNAEIPFVGLSAGVFLGLLLVPLAGVSAAAGAALASAKK